MPSLLWVLILLAITYSGVILISLVPLLGYVSGNAWWAMWGTSTPMAPNTAFCLLCLASAGLCRLALDYRHKG